MPGYTLLELMFVTSLSAILAAAAIPQTMAGIDRWRTVGAARYLASRLALARTLAVARSANVALVIVADGDSFTVAAHHDGNGNGVRTRDIAAGIDPAVEPPIRFNDLFPRVSLFLNNPDASSPDTTALMSFTPLGTATSGTLYLRGPDRSEYAVRVLGATGRTRVLRYVPTTRQWIEIL